MRNSIRIAMTLLLALSMAGCNKAEPVVDQQAAVNTAVAATMMAQALAEATVNAAALTAIPATSTAQALATLTVMPAAAPTEIPATPTAAPVAATAVPPAAAPTPTPGAAVDYTTLSEEELAALIDAAVAEAIVATEQTAQAVTYTTTDDAITAEEVAYVYPYYDYAEYTIAYAEELLDVYYDLYGALADEMIDELVSVESELEELNSTLLLIAGSLEEMSSLLAQGLALTEESIAQLESAAQQAQAGALALQAQQQDMLAILQADQQQRADLIAQVQPNQVPDDRVSAVLAGFQYVDLVSTATGDGTLSLDELLAIAQAGANAQAGAQAFAALPPMGGATVDLAQLGAQFGEITGQLAAGQVPQATGNAQSLAAMLGQRPDAAGAAGTLTGGIDLPDPGTVTGGGLPGGGNLPGGATLPGGGNLPGRRP